jgi:hypothetical protein
MIAGVRRHARIAAALFIVIGEHGSAAPLSTVGHAIGALLSDRGHDPARVAGTRPSER